MGDGSDGSEVFRECAAGKRPGKEVWSLAVVTDKTHATDTCSNIGLVHLLVHLYLCLIFTDD